MATKTDDEQEAQKIAEQLQNTANIAGQMEGRHITRDHFEGLLANILTAAGVHVTEEVQSPPLREILEAYMDFERERVEAVSFKTYNSHRNSFVTWLDMQENSNPFSNLFSIQDANEYASYLLKVKKVSPKTLKERVKFMKRLYDHEIKRERLHKNPFDSVNVSVKGKTLGRLHMSMREVEKIIEHLKLQQGKKREWLKAVLISIQTGARLEDCMTMRRDSIKGGILTYTPQKTKQTTLSCPLVKDEWAKIILEGNEPLLCPELGAYFAKHGSSDMSADFTHIVIDAGVKQEYQEFENGRRVARKTFHSLRHTLRTLIVSSGGSDAQADLILGHSAGQGKTYTHSEVEALKGVLTKVFN